MAKPIYGVSSGGITVNSLSSGSSWLWLYGGGLGIQSDLYKLNPCLSEYLDDY